MDGIKILLIDDDHALTQLLQMMLQRQGYYTSVAHTGSEGLKMVWQWRPNLIVLDLMMPGMDGTQVCQRLREVSNIPILVLTAKASVQDTVEMLRAGADDFMAKPFHAQELVARIEALLRRTTQIHVPDRRFFPDSGIEIDYDQQQVTINGVQVHLTPAEFTVLRCLTVNHHQIVSKESLLTELWKNGNVCSETAIKFYINGLRRKIESDTTQPMWILNERGVGYRFDG